jgi:hypothetical protein
MLRTWDTILEQYLQAILALDNQQCMVLNYKWLVESGHQGSGQPQALSSLVEGVQKCELSTCGTVAVQTVEILVTFFDVCLLKIMKCYTKTRGQNRTDSWEWEERRLEELHCHVRGEQYL